MSKVIFSFLGIDGSGKTTQAVALKEFFQEQGLDTAYVWSRREPYLSRIPARIFKKLVLRESGKTEGEAYTQIKRKRTDLFKNPLLRYLWINFSLLEYLSMIHIRIISPNKGRDLLICDRYLNDAIIDFALSCSMTRAEVTDTVRGAVARTFPAVSRAYFIDIDAEVGAKRKQDGTSVAYLQDRVPMYRHVAEITGALRIDGSLPLETIQEMIRRDAQAFLAGLGEGRRG